MIVSIYIPPIVIDSQKSDPAKRNHHSTLTFMSLLLLIEAVFIMRWWVLGMVWPSAEIAEFVIIVFDWSLVICTFVAYMFMRPRPSR